MKRRYNYYSQRIRTTGEMIENDVRKQTWLWLDRLTIWRRRPPILGLLTSEDIFGRIDVRADNEIGHG